MIGESGNRSGNNREGDADLRLDSYVALMFLSNGKTRPCDSTYVTAVTSTY